MGKGQLIVDCSAVVTLSDFEEEDIKAYCKDNKLFTPSELRDLLNESPLTMDWWAHMFQQITAKHRGIYTKEDLKDYLCDIVDNNYKSIFK